MENVQDLIKEIAGVTGTSRTCTASRKDEVRIMKAMMNDKEYKVAVYDKNGQTGFICPSQELRDMCATVLSATTKISAAEAEQLMDNHEFKRSEAEHLIEFSKEFVHTYLHTGRKLPLGGREKSNVAFSLKSISEGYRTYPKCIGVDKDGNKQYAAGKTHVNAYESVKVHAPAPAWVEDKEEVK